MVNPCLFSCLGMNRNQMRDDFLPGARPLHAGWLRRLALGCACGVLWLTLAIPAVAQIDPEAPSWGYALSHELMSPFCPGRTLAACTSPQAAELRQWILLQEAAGTNREEVIGILEERYGDVIRSTPEVEGWGLAAWLLPVGALAIGAALVFFVLRRMVDPSAAAGAKSMEASAPIDLVDDDDLARRVDQELAARDG